MTIIVGKSSVDDVQFDNILQLTTIHMHIVGLMQAIRYTIIVIITLSQSLLQVTFPKI